MKERDCRERIHHIDDNRESDKRNNYENGVSYDKMAAKEGKFTSALIRKFLIAAGVILIIIGALILVFTWFFSSDDSFDSEEIYVTDSESVPDPIQKAPEIPLVFSEDGVTPVKGDAVIEGTEYLYENSVIIANPDDYYSIVNRKYNLPMTYNPSDLVMVDVPFAPGREDAVKKMRRDAANALSQMFEAANTEKGFELYGASGYRSFIIQKIWFEKKIKQKGSIENAKLFSAVPGQSEHQLGLAMDITSKDLNYKLFQDFGETETGRWLTDNCYRFGFILRYPADKEDVTGYKYEPWHFRYVGNELAEYLYKNNLTLEEYYGV